MEESQIVQRMIGKTIERIEKYEMSMRIWFTDGDYLDIEAHTTEEGWLTLDGNL